MHFNIKKPVKEELHISHISIHWRLDGFSNDTRTALQSRGGRGDQIGYKSGKLTGTELQFSLIFEVFRDIFNLL